MPAFLLFLPMMLVTPAVLLAQSQTPSVQPTAPATTSPAPATANPAPAPAQAAPDAANSTPFQLTVQSNEVNLLFTVTDKKGHFITDLKITDFGLLDDGRPPLLPILRFTPQTNLPLRVGIMLDTSSSVRTRFQFEQDTAIEFLLQTLRPATDRAFVEGFDVGPPDVEQKFTNNMDLLNQGIHRLRPGGGTALYDALYITCRDQMLTVDNPGGVRRALIMVSDGEDNYSHALEGEAIRECQRADTIVYTISTNTSAQNTKGDDVLRNISDATGGRAYFPTRLEDIAGYFTNIQEELRSQYLLVYRPANFKNDGSFRTIYLHTTSQQYVAHAKTGYFSPTPHK